MKSEEIQHVQNLLRLIDARDFDNVYWFLVYERKHYPNVAQHIKNDLIALANAEVERVFSLAVILPKPEERERYTREDGKLDIPIGIPIHGYLAVYIEKKAPNLVKTARIIGDSSPEDLELKSHYPLLDRYRTCYWCPDTDELREVISTAKRDLLDALYAHCAFASDPTVNVSQVFM